MGNTVILRNLIRAVFLLSVQVLVLRQLNIGGADFNYINIFLYPIFLMLYRWQLPFGWWWQLVFFTVLALMFFPIRWVCTLLHVFCPLIYECLYCISSNRKVVINKALALPAIAWVFLGFWDIPVFLCSSTFSLSFVLKFLHLCIWAKFWRTHFQVLSHRLYLWCF